MILNIPKIEQVDNECGPAVAAQVLAYFKIPFVMEDIISYSSNSYKFRDWDYLIAQYLNKKGLETNIVAFQSSIFDPIWQELDNVSLIEKMKLELEFFYSDSPRLQHKGFLAWHNLGPEISELEEAIKYLEMGGQISLKPISAKDIMNEIKKGHPIICAYDAILLHGMKRGFMGKPDDIKGVPMGHVAVISGFDKDNFVLVDPSYWYKRGESYLVNKDRLINSIILRNSQYIVCKKIINNDRDGKRK
jgi:hypothetical protein